MQENRHGLQCRIFQTREYLLQFKLQIALFVPLVAVDECNLIHRDKNQKARRLRSTKQDFGCKVLVCDFRQNALVQCPGRIFINGTCIIAEALHNARIFPAGRGKNHPQKRCTVALRHFQIDRNRQGIVYRNCGRICLRITKRFQIQICQHTHT